MVGEGFQILVVVVVVGGVSNYKKPLPVHLSTVMKCLLRARYLWLLDWMMLLHCPHPPTIIFFLYAETPHTVGAGVWTIWHAQLVPWNNTNYTQKKERKTSVCRRCRKKCMLGEKGNGKKCLLLLLFLKELQNTLITVKTNRRSPYVVVQAHN